MLIPKDFVIIETVLLLGFVFVTAFFVAFFINLVTETFAWRYLVSSAVVTVVAFWLPNIIGHFLLPPVRWFNGEPQAYVPQFGTNSFIFVHSARSRASHFGNSSLGGAIAVFRFDLCGVAAQQIVGHEPRERVSHEAFVNQRWRYRAAASTQALGVIRG